MSDIRYIKIIARKIEILTQWKMAPSKGIIQAFLVGLVHYITWRCRLLALELNILKKIQSVRFHVSKTSSQYKWNPLDVVKDL